MINLALVVALIKKLAPAADPATIQSAVEDWLDDHPEATTTVQDGSITEAKLAADVSEILSGLSAGINRLLFSKPLANIYTAQAISDIMDGYILKRGVPQTQYGSGYYVTDFIPVSGGDTLDANFVTWQAADDIYRAAEYDSSKEYIKVISSFPHKLSDNAAFIRLSVKKSEYGGTAATALAYINANFMLTNGETVDTTGIDETKNIFLAGGLSRKEDKYFVDSSTNEILIVSKMPGKDEKDVGLKMKTFSSNNSFQFCSFGTIDNNTPFVSNTPEDYAEYMNTGEDFFGPIVGYAKENIDGDSPNDGHFTGGMHKFNGYNTARRISMDIYYDGRKIPGFVGYCRTIDIVMIQNLQVSNTVKNDGTGREAIEEITRLHFEDGTIRVETLLKALEPVEIQTFYFMQGNHKGNGMGSGGIRYIGGDANRGINSMDEESNSGDKKARVMRLLSDTIQMDLEIDDFDLGRFEHSDAQEWSAFTNVYSGYSKCYFNAIRATQQNRLNLDTGDVCIARGSIKLGIFE